MLDPPDQQAILDPQDRQVMSAVLDLLDLQVRQARMVNRLVFMNIKLTPM